MTTRFRREVGSTLVAQFVALVLNAITLALVARWLGPSAKGVQALVGTSAQLVATVGSLGLAGSVPYFVAGSPDRTAAVLRNGTRVLAVVLVLGSVVAVVGRSIGGSGLEGHEPVLLLIAATTFAQGYSFALLLALRDVRSFNMLIVADAVIAFGGTVVVQQLVPASPDAFLAVQALGMAIASAAAVARVRSLEPAMPRRALALGTQARVAFLGFLSGAFMQLTTRADIFIVTAIGGGLAAAGIYSVAVAVSEAVLRVPQWVAQLLTPRVARAAAGQRTTVLLVWIAMTSTAIASVAIFVLRAPLESLLGAAIGPGFVPAYAVMLALMPRIVFQSGSTMLAGHLAGRGYTLYHPVATGIGVLVVLGIDLVLVPTLGPVGAGLGASGGALVTLIIFAIGFRRITGDTAPIRDEEAFG